MNGTELLRLTGLPVYQNKMYADRASSLACPKGDLVIVQSTGTGLVHNAAFDPGLLEYDPSYQNEQGHSSAFQSHMDDVLEIIRRHFAGLSILEVGCGKGSFLRQMQRAGMRATGIDPAYEGDDPGIVKRRFEPGCGCAAEAVVLRHTLEHLRDPMNFLAELKESNDLRGLIYIEVPCLDWILSHQAWFDFFYEHVNYFRLTDFHRMFGRVLEAGRLFGGQYLYAVCDLATLRAVEDMPAAERVLWPDELFSRLDTVVQDFLENGPLIVWGAAAKGVTFCHHAIARGCQVDMAIDINPAKQGHFLAGSGVEVLAPDHALRRLKPGSTIWIMNSNYFEEVARVAGPGFRYLAMDNQ